MQTELLTHNGVEAVVVSAPGVLIQDAQSALDLAMTITHDTGCRRIALYKEAVAQDFFKLSTGLAGEVLQKFINYNIKVAFIGDFSGYTSKPLRDFIHESNSGRDIFFVPTQADAVQRLTTVRD